MLLGFSVPSRLGMVGLWDLGVLRPPCAAGSSLCQLGIQGWALGNSGSIDFISLFIFISCFQVRKQILCHGL